MAEAAEVVPGCGLRVLVGGIPIGIYRVGGRWFAMEDTCPHAGAALSSGTVSGTIVTCPVHGYEYDLETGFRPGDDDGFPIPRFPVRVEDGEVWLDVDLPGDDEDA